MSLKTRAKLGQTPHFGGPIWHYVALRGTTWHKIDPYRVPDQSESGRSEVDAQHDGSLSAQSGQQHEPAQSAPNRQYYRYAGIRYDHGCGRQRRSCARFPAPGFENVPLAVNVGRAYVCCHPFDGVDEETKAVTSLICSLLLAKNWLRRSR